jgi:hypothetical protein
MILDLKLRNRQSNSAWSKWEYGCDHRRHGEWPGEICVQVPITRTGYGGYSTDRQLKVCIECALEALNRKKLNVKGTKPSEPFDIGAEDRDEGAHKEILATAESMLKERGPVTTYWADQDHVFALGPAREPLSTALKVKVNRPKWADPFQRLLKRSSFAGWVSSDGLDLTPLGSARLAALVESDTYALGALKDVIIAAARCRAEEAPNAAHEVAKHGVTGTVPAETKLIEELLAREMRFSNHPEIGLVLQNLLNAPLLAFKPARGEPLDGIANLGWGRNARIQVEPLDGTSGILDVKLVSGSLDEYEEALVIRADGGDVRIWIQYGFAPALEGMPPPSHSRRRRKAAEPQGDDDDGGDDGPENPNWPSTTGNPSGGGRGNNPPSN